MNFKNILGDIFSSLIGVALMVFSLGSYFFGWPNEASAITDLTIGLIGVLFLGLDMKQLTKKAFEFLTKKK